MFLIWTETFDKMKSVGNFCLLSIYAQKTGNGEKKALRISARLWAQGQI